MTYGQIRLHLQKALPGVDSELIDDWIQGRYTRILDAIAWKRQETESVIQAPASYSNGTVTATQGSNVVASDDLSNPTVFTLAMTGRMIRIDNQSEYYQFTYVSATSGTLDRPYEGPNITGASYRIDQAIFLLPSNCRVLRQVTPLHDYSRSIPIVPPSFLNRLDGSRNSYGTPCWAAATWDNFSDPPQMQIELYPVPDVPDPSTSSILSYAIDYLYDEADLDPDVTSVTLKPFVKPACLIEGVKADAMRPRPSWDGNMQAAEAYEAQYDKLLGEMQSINAQQRGPQQIQFAANLRRQTQTPRHLSTAWQRGIPPGGWGPDE
jgi:hypothetical protein